MLAELVQTPSDNPPGDGSPIARKTVELLTELGFSVEEHPVPEEACQAVGMKHVTNLVVRERFGDGPVVALNAHGDVVPPGEGWSVDPYSGEVREGQLYGRGAAVSKSDIATFTYALLALRTLGQGHGTVELHITFDEEAGGVVGPQRLLASGVTRPDLAISAGFTYQVVTAHNGCLHLEVVLRGKSSHAAEPGRGRDALEAATAVLGALYTYRKTLAATTSQVEGIGSPTLVVGMISGGINTNVVPDRVALRLDRRMIPEEDPEGVERGLIEEIQSTASLWPDIECAVKRLLLAEPLRPVAGSDALSRVIQDNARAVLGEEIPALGVPLYTDARHYSAAGIPTVLFGAGPRTLAEAGAHGPDERVRLEDLALATRIVAASLVDLLE